MKRCIDLDWGWGNGVGVGVLGTVLSESYMQLGGGGVQVYWFGASEYHIQ